ncbi:MAG TPA: ATP-binding protein [Oxalicibacterium sp.]
MPRLFDRFYRVDSSRLGSAQASGLGLAIVRSIMQLHQGSCTVASDGQGTRFNLHFPQHSIHTNTVVKRRSSPLFQYQHATVRVQTAE